MSRNQHQLEYDHMGSYGSNAKYKELASDPSSATAGTQTLYARPSGMYVINSSGLITGPFGTGGSSGGAFGSNANDVGNPSTGGANSSNSRADHVHLGVRAITANTSNTLTQPNVSLVSGAGIAFGVSASTLTISALGAGSGSSSGVTVRYPALKPATPTDDFAAASLAGAWIAHSSGGTFATGNCLTQGEDWVGSSLDMEFSGQMGALYRTHADTDLDFSAGGFRSKGLSNTSGTQVMFGIAALNSLGTGVGVVVYNDGNVYLATITTWGYAANSDSWTGQGMGTATGLGGDWWLRLKRVSGTWTGYASQSGRAWDKTFSTRADSITVDRLAVGLLYNTGLTYSGRLTLDYFQVDV